MTTNYGIKFSDLPSPELPITKDFRIPGIYLGDLNNYTVSVQDILNTFTKADLGLDLVDNTPDLQKPISVAASEALNTKSDVGHIHSFGEIQGLEDYVTQRLDSQTYSMSAIVGLSEALSNKTDVGHHHLLSDIDGLVEALAAKADAAHIHSLNDINGAVETIQSLWAAVNGKADRIHTHTVDQVIGFDSAVRQVIQSEHPNIIVVDVGVMEW